MEFGKVPEEEIKQVDFTLPPDGGQIGITLKKGARTPDPAFYVGCAKWGRKEWLNLIYPDKTKEADFLEEYVKHFNSIELNAVFYGIPKAEMIGKWRSKAENAENGFLFFPKFPQIISHIKRLQHAEEATDQFISSISEFGDHLGPCFLQLSDNFGPDNRKILENYLEHLPLDLKVFVELRHKNWFADAATRKEVFSMLASLKKGAVITDASGRRDCVHMELSTPQAFIRFVGNGQSHQDTDFKRVEDWAVRLRSWLDQGLEEVYFFLHQHDEKDTPILAAHTIKTFNKYLGSTIPEIKFIPKQGALFI